MTTKILNGELEAYWEQGMEGLILFSFMPENGKGLNDLIALQSGQHLTIFNPDGSTLWSGTLNFVRRHDRRDQHKLDAGIWSYEKQKDVSYADWMAWFWHEPPLKAKLEFEEEKTETQKPKEISMTEKQTDHPNINKNVHPPIVAMGFIIVGLVLGKLVPA